MGRCPGTMDVMQRLGCGGERFHLGRCRCTAMPGWGTSGYESLDTADGFFDKHEARFISSSQEQ